MADKAYTKGEDCAVSTAVLVQVLERVAVALETLAGRTVPDASRVEDQAMQALTESILSGSSLNIAELARSLGVTRQRLYRMPRFAAALKRMGVSPVYHSRRAAARRWENADE